MIRGHSTQSTARRSCHGIRSASFRAGVKDVVTLLVKSRWSINNALGVGVTRGMYSISLAFKRYMQDCFSGRF
jgi:hypothetical protein